MKNKKRLRKNVKAILIGLFASLAIVTPVGIYAANSYTYTTKDPKTTSSAVSAAWTQTGENTWVMDTNGDGKTDVTLKSSINSDGKQQWDYTYNVEDDKQSYYVYEEMTNNGSLPLKTGYTASGTDGKQAIPQEPGLTGTGSYTVTNSTQHGTTAVKKYGNLKITKNVTGSMSDPDQKFNFTITLSSTDSTIQNDIKGIKAFGDVAFNDGIGKVSLGNGESVTINNLPANVNYTITEEPVDGYENSSKTNNTGTIPADNTIESVWTNNSTYTPPAERKTASFTLQKKVTGSAKPDIDKYYQYSVHLENLKINTNFTYTIGSKNYNFKSDKDGIADITLKLKNNEKAVFNKVQVESTYQISENNKEYDEDNSSVDGTFIPSYTVTDANNLNEIVSSNSTGQVGQKLNTAKETVDDGENVTVTYNNDYPASQSLTLRKFISKEINGKKVTTDKNSAEYKALSSADKSTMDKEAEKEFEFTIEFSNLPQNAKISSSVGRVVPDEDGECSKTFKLKADGSEIRFVDIPEGTKYQIKENADQNYTSSYEITTVDTKGKTIKGTVVSNKADSSITKTETVEDNQSDIVTFTNNPAPPIIIPTGITLEVIAGILMILIGIIAGIIVYRKKKNID